MANINLMDNKELSVLLSIFIIIASALGILTITSSSVGVTGFAVFEKNEILGKINIGVSLVIAFAIAIIIALSNIVFIENKKIN